MNAACSVANDRRHLVGKDRWEERQVARVARNQIADRRLAFGEAVRLKFLQAKS
jgi:hypothetical protein